MFPESRSTTTDFEILIVEDSPTQAMELELTLKRHGYRTSIAVNGRDALDWLGRNKPAMVISDIVMPEIDGYELCRAIRRDEKLKGIPVVLLSFLSHAGDVLKGIESGASNFIVKPYNSDHLISYIREELSRNHSGAEDLSQPPVVVEYAGMEYTVSSGVRQILDILLSTYGTAVCKNEELIRAESELRQLNENLEEKVKARTAALTAEIAERRRVEEELRQAEEKFRSIFENAVEGIFQSSIDGRFIMVNPAMARILGYESPEELIACVTDMDHRLFLNPEQCSEFRTSIEEQGSIFGFEFQASCKGGSIVWVSMNARCVRDSSGMPLRYEGILEDISERRHAEEELRAYSVKLEQSNRELQDFAFIASHDLQEPLRKIQTFANLVITKYADSLDDRGKDYLFRMQQTASRMHNLVRSSLEYSRATEKTECFDRIELARPVQEAVSDLKLLIEDTGAIIEVGNLATVEADESLMRQLFQNLIGNALKFRSKERRAIVRVHCERCDGALLEGKTCLGGFCRITVEDNGIGFNEKYLDRIFKAFQRLHGRNEYDGTGVGLAICRKIVDHHKGEITAKSKPGEGSSFMITLPLKQPKCE